MTKKEIVQHLNFTKNFIDMILKHCTDVEFVKQVSEELKQVTVFDNLSCYDDVAEDLQDCIDALLNEHGDKNMVAFAEEEM